VGLQQEECKQIAEPLYRLAHFLMEEDQTLIVMFKTVVEDASRSKEMISRVLFKRQSKEVDRFFDDYKTVFSRS